MHVVVSRQGLPFRCDAEPDWGTFSPRAHAVAGASINAWRSIPAYAIRNVGHSAGARSALGGRNLHLVQLPREIAGEGKRSMRPPDLLAPLRPESFAALIGREGGARPGAAERTTRFDAPPPGRRRQTGRRRFHHRSGCAPGFGRRRGGSDPARSPDPYMSGNLTKRASIRRTGGVERRHALEVKRSPDENTMRVW
jgi:hypothetical protein